MKETRVIRDKKIDYLKKKKKKNKDEKWSLATQKQKRERGKSNEIQGKREEMEIT